MPGPMIEINGLIWHVVIHYLVGSVSVLSKETLKAYKGLDVYKYLIAGYAKDVEAKNLGSGPGMVVSTKVSCSLLHALSKKILQFSCSDMIC